MKEKSNNELSIEIQKTKSISVVKNQPNYNWVYEWLNQTNYFSNENMVEHDSNNNHEYLNDFKFYLN
jgi:hypothetical protein